MVLLRLWEANMRYLQRLLHFRLVLVLLLVGLCVPTLR